MKRARLWACLRRQAAQLIGFIVVCASPALAQSSWWRTYGGTDGDGGYSVQQTTDGGYIIVGYACSFGAGGADVYLVKTSASGDTLWTRTCGGTEYDVGSSVQQTSDGGYIITGWTRSFGPGTPTCKNVYLIKTSASGDTLWTRTCGGTGDDEGGSVQQTTDGGYIITGYTYPPSAWSGDVYLIKTDSSGDTLWTRTYGGSEHDGGNSVQQTTDGGYIIAGSTFSFGSGTPNYANVYLIKTDAQGDTLWTRTHGGPGSDHGFSVQQTSDSGYIITGRTFGTGGVDVYLVKTDAQGDTLWTRTYGGPDYEEGYSVQQTADGCYIVVGYTGPYLVGNHAVYLIKTGASGDTIWTRTYGGPGSDQGFSVRQTSDSGYIIAGYTLSFGAGSYDVFLIKTDSNGYGIEEPSTGHRANPTRILVRPNPFTSFARVQGHETDVFALSDITGRQVAICKGDRIGEGLPPGVYFLSPVKPALPRFRPLRIVKGG